MFSDKQVDGSHSKDMSHNRNSIRNVHSHHVHVNPLVQGSPAHSKDLLLQNHASSKCGQVTPYKDHVFPLGLWLTVAKSFFFTCLKFLEYGCHFLKTFTQSAVIKADDSFAPLAVQPSAMQQRNS